MHLHDVLPGDLYLMCSDGLSDMLDDETIAQVLTSNDSLEEAGAEMPSLRRAFVVGDLLKRSDVERLQRVASNVTCINLYGSTETQRSVSYFVVPRPGEARPGEVRPAEVCPVEGRLGEVRPAEVHPG